MAILFSAVNVSANDQKASFIAAGKPRSFADLTGIPPFDSLIGSIMRPTTVIVTLDVYTLGDGQATNACPEDINAISRLCAVAGLFPEKACTKKGSAGFSELWVPRN